MCIRDRHYSVKLTGITAAGARIGIPVNEVYGTQENPNTSQSFTISADDWQYAEVELTVIRLGQAYGCLLYTSTFPVEYDRTNKRATLVLDGMMNAKLYDRLDKLSADNEAAFRQSSDTSITRFGGKLENPLNVYAAVQVFPDPNAENTGGEEYQKSDAIESNKANTLFGDGTRSDNGCLLYTSRCV